MRGTDLGAGDEAGGDGERTGGAADVCGAVSVCHAADGDDAGGAGAVRLIAHVNVPEGSTEYDHPAHITFGRIEGGDYKREWYVTLRWRRIRHLMAVVRYLGRWYFRRNCWGSDRRSIEHLRHQ